MYADQSNQEIGGDAAFQKACAGKNPFFGRHDAQHLRPGMMPLVDPFGSRRPRVTMFVEGQVINESMSPDC